MAALGFGPKAASIRLGGGRKSGSGTAWKVEIRGVLWNMWYEESTSNIIHFNLFSETTPGVYQASGYADLTASEHMWFVTSIKLQ